VTTDRCIAAHRVDPDRPRQAADGKYLCQGHLADLEQLVAEMPAIHDDLTRPSTPGPKAYGGGGESHGLTVDDAAADLRRHMEGVVASWCRVVVEERGARPPASEAIHHTSPWLVNARTDHLGWCAANRWVDEMLAELRELRGKATGLVDLPARKVPLEAPCLVHADGEPCPGTVTIIVRGDDWTARCDTCPDPQDATPYVRALSRPGQTVDVAGVIRLAHMAGIPCSPDVVRQWAHRGKIKGGDGSYELASVHDYLARRQAKSERIAS
jgi:hypothetical protein